MPFQIILIQLALEGVVLLFEGSDGLIEGFDVVFQLIDLLLMDVVFFLVGGDHEVYLGLKFLNLAVEFLVFVLEL